MPGQYYIYLPFNSSNTKELAELWRSSMLEYICRKIATQEGHRIPGYPDATPDFYDEEILNKALTHPDCRKIPIVCVHGEASLQQLIQIGLHDVLYIVAHGCLDPAVVSSGEGEYLKAEALVSRMVEDQVPNRVLRMKLYSCNGGAGSASFAETMRLAMNKPFPRSDLYAYTEAVTANRIQEFSAHGQLLRQWGSTLESHRASARYTISVWLRGGFAIWPVGRASDSRIRLARPLPLDEIDEVDGAVYEDLIAGLSAVDRILTRADQMALTSRASGLATGLRTAQFNEPGPPKYAGQSED